MLFRKFIFVFALFVFSSVGVAKTDPLTLVKETANKVLEEVTVHKTALELDASGMFTLVSSHILPHFDFEKMTRSAMGKYWRRATDEQKIALTEQFRQLLVKTYAVALMNYSGQEIIYLPLRPSDDENRVTVQTKVSEEKGGPQIPVHYRLIQKDDNWLVYDVVIDGVSLVSNYRSSFAGEIRRTGIDGLVKYLESRSKS